ncbi:MAG: hypothetical protein LQ338_001297 [Usnochroma carphineum]|nr:MAG: hypothetical protein LQ338_001297 [Usnochroma carphineum]
MSPHSHHPGGGFPDHSGAGFGGRLGGAFARWTRNSSPKLFERNTTPDDQAVCTAAQAEFWRRSCKITEDVERFQTGSVCQA